MKLTREDVKKYGTVEEKKILEDSQLDRANMADLEYYLESVYNRMDWDMGKKEIIDVLREVYDKEYNKGYKDGDYYINL